MISDKQVKLYNKIIEREPSEIYVQGSVQSGKTWVIALAVIGYTKELFKYDPDKKYNGAIIGWDLDTLKRNVVTPLLNFLDDLGYTNGDEYELKWGNEKYFKFLNMTYFFFGFNTKLSFNKILGGPLLFVWIDESARIYSNTTLQEPFDEIPGRQMSYVGHPFKRTIHSFNVEGNENHPYKKTYIDNKKNAIHFTFYPVDNPQIDTLEKIQEVVNIYPPGSLRKQKIFNHWVVSEGRVFNTLNVIKNLDNLIIREIGIGADYGSVNPTTFVPHALCFNTKENRWVIVRLGVYYHDPGINGEKPTTAFYVEQFKSFLKYLHKKYENIPITCNVIDSEATHYANALYNANVDYTLATKGPGSVDKGVQQLQSLIYKKVYYILEENSVDYFDMNKEPVYSSKDESKLEFEGYQYDTIKSLNTGTNCYKKEKDHSIDSSRYLIDEWQRQGKCPVI
jgi:PBSX family phage terminase large subunit